MRRMVKVVPEGSPARLIASDTCSAATAMSVSQLKLIEICADPRLVTDRMPRTPSTDRTASSEGYVTSVAMRSAGRSPASMSTTTRGK